MSEVSQIRPTAAESHGKYRVLAMLGRGGMAEVDLALCHGPMGFNKLVVIKRILPTLAEDPTFVTMFLDEARLAARLNHPNVVQTYEAGAGDDGYFMAMEYLEGQPLNRVLVRLGREGMPCSLHLRLIADALAGLHHAHELVDYDGTPLGVVHRDISPHNLFVTYDGVVKIVDFGIAKAKSSISQTQVGIVKGKVTYMAPEQARMEDVDRRADIFAVGVMLWEAATGVRLWAGKTDGGILKCLLAGELPSPRSVKPSIPDRLEKIIMKALSHDREKRHATAAELQADIESFLDEAGGRVLSREVGQLVAECFACERASIRATIDQQLSSVESGVPSTSVPLIEHPTGSGADRAARSSDRATKIEGNAGSASLPAVTTTPPEPPRAEGRPSNKQKFLWMAGGAGVLAAALMAATWAPTPAGQVPIAGAAVSVPAVVEEARTEPPVRDDVEIGISAQPPSAMIFIDDRALVGNPWRGRLPRDSGLHQLRIEAPGFAPKIEDIALDRNREIERVLAKSEPEAPAKAPSRRVAAEARPPSVAIPQGVAPIGRTPSGGTANGGTANVDGRIIRTDLP